MIAGYQVGHYRSG